MSIMIGGKPKNVSTPITKEVSSKGDTSNVIKKKSVPKKTKKD